jgi:hypothetical protein
MRRLESTTAQPPYRGTQPKKANETVEFARTLTVSYLPVLLEKDLPQTAFNPPLAKNRHIH